MMIKIIYNNDDDILMMIIVMIVIMMAMMLMLIMILILMEMMIMKTVMVMVMMKMIPNLQTFTVLERSSYTLHHLHRFRHKHRHISHAGARASSSSALRIGPEIQRKTFQHESCMKKKMSDFPRVCNIVPVLLIMSSRMHLYPQRPNTVSIPISISLPPEPGPLPPAHPGLPFISPDVAKG